MKHLKFPFTALLILPLLLVWSCSPESDFDRWLTKKEGNWNIYGASYRIVEYSSPTDSTISEAFNLDEIGTLRFYDPMQCEVDFELAGIDWTGVYTYSADENGFFMQNIFPSITYIGETRLTISGYNTSRKSMRVEFRNDIVPINTGFPIIRASMDVERIK